MRRAAVSTALLALSVTLAVPASARPASPADLSPVSILAGLTATGDLNGDGHADVLDLRQSSLMSNGPRSYGVTARDGRTGKVLWAHAFSEAADDFAEAMPARLGTNGAHDVLVEDTHVVNGASGPESQTVRLRAYAGKSGKLLWTTSFTGTYGNTGEQTDLPTFLGVINRPGGKAATLLVTQETSSGSDRTTTLQVVSGATGSASSPYGGVTGTNLYPGYEIIGDVSGDHQADVLQVIYGSPSSVQALRSDTFDPVWTNSSLDTDPLFANIVDAGVLSGSVHDLALVTAAPIGGSGTVTLIRGSDGHAMWTRKGDRVLLIGRAGSGLHRAIGLEHISGSDNGTTSRVTFHLTAVRADNTVVYRHSATTSVTDPPGSSSRGWGGGAFVAGDVQRDGAKDLLLEIDVHSDATQRVLRGLVDGRTGKFAAVHADTGTAGSLHKGPRTDVVNASVPKHRFTLAAYRGSDRHRDYRRTVGGYRHVRGAYVQGMRVTGHHCSDLAFSAAFADHDVIGVLSARGAVVWSVRFASDKVTGGTRHRATPAHYCV